MLLLNKKKNAKRERQNAPQLSVLSKQAHNGNSCNFLWIPKLLFDIIIMKNIKMIKKINYTLLSIFM